MKGKRPLGINVLEAARERISWAFDTFPRLCVSFSGGKDSTVMLHLVMDEARRRNRRVALLLIDLEAQYRVTIDLVQKCFDEYRDHIEPHWICLPLSLRNAVSMFEPRWRCWEPEEKQRWVREPPAHAITNPMHFSFFRPGMEFEEFVEQFAVWYCAKDLGGFFVGIRADESLNRYRTLAMSKSSFEGKCWTTWKGAGAYNLYPLYDWKTQDIWTYNAKTGKCYNRVYDLMHGAGLSVHQMRICQPYGDDQRKGLWLYHVLEPETWGKIIARVSGANAGALYAKESGNITGTIKVQKPDGHTWESFAKLLLESLPPKSREHFENKIATFVKWYEQRGYLTGIPDEANPIAEAQKKVPSWRRICKALLRNDYWCKGLSFSQTRSTAYQKYLKIMKNRKARWGMNG